MNVMGLKELFADKLAVSADIVHSNADNILASAEIKEYSAVVGPQSYL